MMESSYIITDIAGALKNIDNWMAPQYVQKDLLNKMNDVYILPEPFGVVLILGAWNFPVQLTLAPLVGAIAAGKLESTVASPLLASYHGCPLRVVHKSHTASGEKLGGEVYQCSSFVPVILDVIYVRLCTTPLYASSVHN